MRWVLMILLAASACTDRTREVPPVRFDPVVNEDMSRSDVGTSTPTPDGICDGRLDGASCALPHASGTCARQRCVRVACESGFASCDDAPGCETSISDPSNCGRCGVACDDPQSCRPGPDGFVCAAGIVCPRDTFDLDNDSNGTCEWIASWETPFAVSPSDLRVDAVGWAGAPLLAGGREGARISTRLGDVPQPTIWPEPLGAATALEVTLDDEFERVVWTDGVSVRRVADQETIFLQPPCEPAAVPRRFVGAAADFVATQFEVFRVDTTCPDVACLEPALSLFDYYAASYPDFAPDELVACDGCSLALPRECLGEAQCTSPGFDASVCAGCDPSGCPDLEIVDLVAAQGELFVVTARGVIAVGSMGLRARSEAPFDPATGGGPRFVGVDADDANLVLLHSTNFIRTVDSDLTPQLPDLGVSFDIEAAALAVDRGVVVAVSNDVVRLIRPGARSGRTAYLGMQTAPGVQGLRPIAPVTTEDGVRVMYTAAGQMFPRLVTRR